MGVVPDVSAAAPSWRVLVPRQYDYWRHVFLRTWRGSAITAFVQPWLYLAAMGLVLGDYVDSGGAALDGAPGYLEFIAPGLLAAQAMQVGTGETMWPVMGRIRWDKAYYGMIATPLRIVDVVLAHLGYAVVRVSVSVAVFCAVLACFGVFTSVPAALAAAGAAVLTGAALAAPVYAFSAGAQTEQGFALIYRLGIMPMFLFSGAFFPVSNLPDGLEWLAKAAPLWHGVELCRMASLGTWSVPAAAMHVAVLGTLVVLGVIWGVRRLDRRLVV